MGNRLNWKGDAINLVWCVPITKAECNLKLEEGADALCNVFDKNQHPFVFHGSRASYV
jgi:hypothetical protein